jgi:hypothetical protein
MRSVRKFVASIGCVMVCGCSAMGVVASPDPLRKLNDAEVLFEAKDRPLPAETLIQDAAQIYRTREDWHGLGLAYREYGDLLKSESVRRWEGIYRRDGFRDKTITFDSRLAKALEFYRLALESYARAEPAEVNASQYDSLTNLYFNMGLASHYLGSDADACNYFAKSFDASEHNRTLNPKVAPPTDVIRRVLEGAKTEAGCSAASPNKALDRTREE